MLTHKVLKCIPIHYKGEFMEVYLIDKETNEVKQTFANVVSFGENYVEYLNNGCRGKLYFNTEIEYIYKASEVTE
jgi:hypothetical protein